MKTASITIRNIPRTVLERIHARAINHRRSMQGEILAILEASAVEPDTTLNVSAVLQWVRLRGLTTPAEAVQMIRAGRDDR